MTEELPEKTPVPDEQPGHHAAAAIAGMQFIVGILITFGVLIPGAFIYFVLIPMGWGAILPISILLVVAACLVYVWRVIAQSKSDPPG